MIPFLHLLPDIGYFGRSLAFLAWFWSVWHNNITNVVVVVVAEEEEKKIKMRYW